MTSRLYRHPAAALLVRAALLLVCGATFSACRAATVRRPYQPGFDREAPAGAMSMAWRLDVRRTELFGPAPEACSTGVLVGNTLVLGTRGRSILGVNVDLGQLAWRQKVSAQIDGQAVYDAVRGQVYLGANDGTLFAVDPKDGKLRWTYKAEGGITQAPEIAGGRLFFATNRGRLYSLDANDGTWQWDYERERPETFTIAGQAVPRVYGNKLYAGFSDGFLVALDPPSGEVAWARSLASASEQYVDVDTSPLLVGDLLIAGSHSGGLYGVSSEDGTVRWRLPVEGAGNGTLVGTTVYFSAPEAGLHAIDAMTGHVQWRRGLSGAGNVTQPLVVGPYLIFSGSRTGLYVVDRATGQLVQTFFPGRGMCAAPTIDAEKQRIFVLSNGGTLYAMNLRW